MTNAVNMPPSSTAHKKAWIVVADGRTARVYEEDAEHGLRLIDKMICTRDHHHLHHVQPQGQSIAPDDAAFIQEVGKWLKDHADNGKFESFAFVADAGFIPHLESGFGASFDGKMTRHIAQGFDNLSDDAVTEKLCNIMYF